MKFRANINMCINQSGQSLITTVLAAALIITGISGTIAASLRLASAMRKSEISNVAVAIETNLVTSLNNMDNYKDPPDSGETTKIVANEHLLNGDGTPLTLTTSFGTISLTPQPMPATSAALDTVLYFTKSADLCTPDFSNKSCVLRLEARLQRNTLSAKAHVYAVSYLIEANPQVSSMKVLGNLLSFDTQIAPGNYRKDQTLTKCDPATDLFMTGANRDTGESFCVAKPSADNLKCTNGHLPKQLIYFQSDRRTKGYLKLVCTAGTMRTYNCPDNYVLQSFDPKYADPDCNPSDGATSPTGSANCSYSDPIGTCVFRTATSATIKDGSSGAAVTLPPDAANPYYLSSVSGTICPPFYTVSGPEGCKAVAAQAANQDYARGAGRCAPTRKKNCTRTASETHANPAYATWVNCNNTRYTCGGEPSPKMQSNVDSPGCCSPPCTPVVVSGSTAPSCNSCHCADSVTSAWTTWDNCMNACGTRPPSTITTDCPSVDTKYRCDTDTIDINNCSSYPNKSGWSQGTDYADSEAAYLTYPTVRPDGVVLGRAFTCTFSDTSTACPAPDLDYNDQHWGKKTPVWYGGVQIQGAICVYDSLQGSGEVVPAQK